jgi:hypothetical protein
VLKLIHECSDSISRSAAIFPRVTASSGAQFTCFTSTKVPVLTSCGVAHVGNEKQVVLRGTQFTCFTSTNVQILTPVGSRTSEMRSRSRCAGPEKVRMVWKSAMTAQIAKKEKKRKEKKRKKGKKKEKGNEKQVALRRPPRKGKDLCCRAP